MPKRKRGRSKRGRRRGFGRVASGGTKISGRAARRPGGGVKVSGRATRRRGGGSSGGGGERRMTIQPAPNKYGQRPTSGSSRRESGAATSARQRMAQRGRRGFAAGAVAGAARAAGRKRGPTAAQLAAMRGATGGRGGRSENARGNNPPVRSRSSSRSRGYKLPGGGSFRVF